MGAPGVGATYDFGGNQPQKLFFGIDTGIAAGGLGGGVKGTLKAGFGWKEKKD